MNKLIKGIIWGLIFSIPIWAIIYVAMKPVVDDFAVWREELYTKTSKTLDNTSKLVRDLEHYRDQVGCYECHIRGTI